MRALLVASLLLLVACGRDPGAPSAEQNRDLDAAERMLDEAPNSLTEIDENALEENGAVSPNVREELR